MNRYFLIGAIAVFWSLFSLADSAYELVNASFESPPVVDDAGHGWDVREFGHSVERDFHIKQEGAASLKVTSRENPQATSLRQQIPSLLIRDGAYAFTGRIRTKKLQGTAALSAIVNRPGGRQYLDWMRGRSATGDTEWTKLRLNIPRIRDAESVSVGILVAGSGTAWFDALDLAPIDPNDTLPVEVSNYLDAALDIMQQHSIVREKVGWEFLKSDTRIAASGARSTEDSYPAIEFAIHMLGDNHSLFYSPEQMSALSSTRNESQNVSMWTASQGQLLFERFGYVTVPAFKGIDPSRMTQYADRLQDVIEAVDSERVCGWIVDLRQNTGGNVFPMLAGIGPILGEGDAGGGVDASGEKILRSYKNGTSGSAAVSRHPYTLINPAPPVAVLIGPKTASSGEATALAFIGRPGTKTFGQPSAGLTTGNRMYTLDDGAVLNLAVTKMIDRTGRIYGGKIEPDFMNIEEHSQDPLKDGTVLAATRWLKTKCD